MTPDDPTTTRVAARPAYSPYSTKSAYAAGYLIVHRRPPTRVVVLPPAWRGGRLKRQVEFQWPGDETARRLLWEYFSAGDDAQLVPAHAFEMAVADAFRIAKDAREAQEGPMTRYQRAGDDPYAHDPTP